MRRRLSSSEKERHVFSYMCNHIVDLEEKIDCCLRDNEDLIDYVKDMKEILRKNEIEDMGSPSYRIRQYFKGE